MQISMAPTAGRQQIFFSTVFYTVWTVSESLDEAMHANKHGANSMASTDLQSEFMDLSDSHVESRDSSIIEQLSTTDQQPA